MNCKDRITFDPAVLLGKPMIKGARLSVELILDRAADGWTMENILRISAAKRNPQPPLALYKVAI